MSKKDFIYVTSWEEYLYLVSIGKIKVNTRKTKQKKNV